MARPKRSDGRKSTTAAAQKYSANNYDRIILNVKKGNRDLIKEYATKQGKTVNKFIGDLLADTVPGFIPLDTENNITKK